MIMTRKIRGFGLLSIATAAIALVAAPTAEALAELHIGTSPAVLTAQQQVQQLVFTIGQNVPVTCTNATFEGLTNEEHVTDITVTPKFSGCKYSNPQIAATFKMNGCKFTYTATPDPVKFNLDITECTQSKRMEIIIGTCKFMVGEQGPLGHISAWENLPGPPKHILMWYTVAGIQYEEVGAFCPDGNGTVGNNGTVFGKTTVKAFELANSKQVTEGTHQFSEYVCGSQVELFGT